MTYHCIIFLEDYKDETLQELMKERDADNIAAYLSQWDHGEYHDDPTDQPWGSACTLTDHKIPYCGEYLLAINYGLGDAALYIEAKE